jgi:hypothetical protein
VARGADHARAQLFAVVLRGQVTVAALRTRIETKRHADSVRALGLVPLATGAAREADLQERYALIQDFQHSGRQVGPGRRASEARAAESALENLACTASYPDPLWLTWALEARSHADLAACPLIVESAEYKVRLALTADRASELTVQRGARGLCAPSRPRSRSSPPWPIW